MAKLVGDLNTLIVEELETFSSMFGVFYEVSNGRIIGMVRKNGE